MMNYIKNIMQSVIPAAPEARESKRPAHFPDTETLARRIRRTRESLNLTQAAVAEATGIHRPNIARIEAGKHSPSLQTLHKISEALQMDPVELFEEPTHMNLQRPLT